MNLTIVTVYTICDDLLMSLGHHNDPHTRMPDAEVMTPAIIASRYFAGNHKTAYCMLKTLGCIPNMLSTSRFNRMSEVFETLFQHLVEEAKSENSNDIYAFDTFLIAAYDNITYLSVSSLSRRGMVSENCKQTPVFLWGQGAPDGHRGGTYR